MVDRQDVEGRSTKGKGEAEQSRIHNEDVKGTSYNGVCWRLELIHFFKRIGKSHVLSVHTSSSLSSM